MTESLVAVARSARVPFLPGMAGLPCGIWRLSQIGDNTEIWNHKQRREPFMWFNIYIKHAVT